eukprot:3389238-Heterocapsa_arctica.AAC.1
MASRPGEVPAGARVRTRDTDFEEAGPRSKSQRTSQLPPASLERRPQVSKNRGLVPEQGWTAEKKRSWELPASQRLGD